MKVILYMAITSNGMIARKDNGTDWVSEEAWVSYNKICREVGNVVIGRRTYEIMVADSELLEDCLYVVLTHNKSLKSKSPNVVFTQQSPKEVLQFLKGKGFDKVLVAGGGGVNSTFFKEGLIDEIYLDIEPIVLGKGIQLFSPKEFEFRLQLVEINKLNGSTTKLHYKVLR